MTIPKDRKIISKESFLRALVDETSIPKIYEENARNRYGSIGECLDRSTSTIKHLQPRISAQGSFALGTVIRPVGDDDSHDVDVVCILELGSRHSASQAQVKAWVGAKIKAYAVANNMNNEPKDCRRCWTLDYADEASFHMDILPGIPALDELIARLRTAEAISDMGGGFASTAIGITD